MIDAAFCLCYDQRWKENSAPIVQLQLDVKKYLNLDLKLFWAGDGKIPEIDYDHIDIPKEQCAQFLERPAEHSQKGHGNAFLCHKKILQRAGSLAKNNGWYKKRVLFLEDDAYFIESRWKSLANDGIDWIQEGDYEGLYLGWQGREYPHDSDDMQRVETYWEMTGTGNIEQCKIGGPKISGLHGIVLSQILIEYLLDVQKGPIDSYLNSDWALDCFNLFYIRPKIIGSRACFSYCENKWQDRSSLK